MPPNRCEISARNAEKIHSEINIARVLALVTLRETEITCGAENSLICVFSRCERLQHFVATLSSGQFCHKKIRNHFSAHGAMRTRVIMISYRRGAER